MIKLTCDRCDKVLEVEDDRAGSKVECPDCGDVNIVPEAKRDRASEMGLPPDDGPEQTVLTLHPAMFRARPLLFLLLALALLAGLVGGIWLLVKEEAAFAGISAGFAVIALLTLAIWKLKTLAVTVTITNKRTIRNVGLLSKATSEVKHEAIRNFQIQQSVKDRLFNVGSIGISSSGQDGIEIVVDDLPRPLKLRKVIDAYRDM